MSFSPNVKQIKPGTSGQVIMTTSGGVVAWGNPLATTSAVGEVQLASQSQAFAGTPDTSGGNPLVIQPSGMLIRKNQTIGTGEIFLMSSTNSPPTIATGLSARGLLALDLQSEIAVSTEVASGSRSIAIGQRNTSSGLRSVTIGSISLTAGDYCTTVGYNNQNNAAERNQIFGNNNSITGALKSRSGIFGYNNATIGSYQYVFGANNNLNSSGSFMFVAGNNNTSGTAASESILIGRSNSGAGSKTGLVGYGNNANDGDIAYLYGFGNVAQSGGSYNIGFGASNSILNNGGANNPHSCSAFGITNTIRGGNSNSAFGFNNDIESTTGNNATFGHGNTIRTGAQNTIVIGMSSNSPVGSSGSVTVGRANDGAGSNSSIFGAQNNANSCGKVVLLGFGNTAQNNTFGSYATYSLAVGFQNNLPITAIDSTAVGRQNSLGGTICTAVGFNNDAANGVTNNLMVGHGNALSISAPSNSICIGLTNTIGGGVAGVGGDNAVIVGRRNHCLSGCNVFGNDNFGSFNIFSTGNAYNTNCFGNTNFAGSAITNCEIFGTNNAVGQTGGTIGSPNPDQTMVFGRNNAVYSSNVLALGFGHYSVLTNDRSTLIGFSNSIPSSCNDSVVLGNSNVWALNGTTHAMALGTKNKIAHNTIGGFGGYGTSATYANAIGYANTAGSDNAIAIGLGNFAGPSAVSSIAIGILNNNDRSIAFIDDATGAATLNAFPSGGPQRVSGLAAIGTNSIAVGSENITAGLNSVAFGRHNDASDTEAVALGVRCRALAAGSTALGNRAQARIANTLNIGGLPIIRKDNGETVGTEFISYSGMPAIIQSKLIDLKTAQIYTIQLPLNARFWTDEVGIEVVQQNAIVAAAPYCSWGTIVDDGSGPLTNQKYRATAQMTSLGDAGTREIFSTFISDFGEGSDVVNTVWLLARIDIAGLSSGIWTGRFYWKGRFVEQ